MKQMFFNNEDEYKGISYIMQYILNYIAKSTYDRNSL